MQNLTIIYAKECNKMQMESQSLLIWKKNMNRF